MSSDPLLQRILTSEHSFSAEIRHIPDKKNADSVEVTSGKEHASYKKDDIDRVANSILTNPDSDSKTSTKTLTDKYKIVAGFLDKSVMAINDKHDLLRYLGVQQRANQMNVDLTIVEYKVEGGVNLNQFDMISFQERLLDELKDSDLPKEATVHVMEFAQDESTGNLNVKKLGEFIYQLKLREKESDKTEKDPKKKKESYYFVGKDNQVKTQNIAVFLNVSFEHTHKHIHLDSVSIVALNREINNLQKIFYDELLSLKGDKWFEGMLQALYSNKRDYFVDNKPVFEEYLEHNPKLKNFFLAISKNNINEDSFLIFLRSLNEVKMISFDSIMSEILNTEHFFKVYFEIREFLD